LIFEGVGPLAYSSFSNFLSYALEGYEFDSSGKDTNKPRD
jgi:hypothetical protein